MFDPKKLKLRHLAFSFLVSYPNRKVEWTPQCLSSGEQSIPQRFSTLFTPLVLFTRLPNLLCLILKSKAAILLLLLLSAFFFSFLFFNFFPFLLLPPVSVFPCNKSNRTSKSFTYNWHQIQGFCNSHNINFFILQELDRVKIIILLRTSIS